MQYLAAISLVIGLISMEEVCLAAMLYLSCHHLHHDHATMSLVFNVMAACRADFLKTKKIDAVA